MLIKLANFFFVTGRQSCPPNKFSLKSCSRDVSKLTDVFVVAVFLFDALPVEVLPASEKNPIMP